MDPITIALGLAQFAPGIIRWITGDDNSKVASAADKIVGVAKSVTGKDSGEAALAAIQADPALALQFQQASNTFELGMYQEETKRLAEVNATMRAEAVSGDGYVRRMRPTWGYCMAFTWVVTMLSIAYIIVTDPGNAGSVVEGLAGMSEIWVVGLSVLGIYTYRRSSEKVTAKTGEVPVGAIGQLAKLVGKR